MYGTPAAPKAPPIRMVRQLGRPCREVSGRHTCCRSLRSASCAARRADEVCGVYTLPMNRHAHGYSFASRTRHFFRIGLLLLPFALRLAAATFSAQGTNLTVTSDKLQVSFAGADVVGISNQLTGESYLRNPPPNMQLDLTLTQPPSQPLAASGTWTVDDSGASASLTFTDSNRTVSITVSVDPATQEVVVNLGGKADQGGVQR